MSDTCFKKNELLIPGTKQDERLPQALNPLSVVPDERKIADLLVFISKYAELINFYSLEDNQSSYIISGNWKPLILSDEAFNYAGISITKYTLPNITFYEKLEEYDTGSTLNKRIEAYRTLWDILFSVYRDINNFYFILPAQMALRNEIASEIRNDLVTDLGKAAGAYLNHATALPTTNLFVSTNSNDEDYKFEFAQDIIQAPFDKAWIDTILAPGITYWVHYLNILNSNPGIANNFFNTASLLTEFDRIDYSTLLLKQIFKRAFQAYARIIAKANDFLQTSLQQNSAHYAHHGLLLAFLKLFGVLQEDMNTFTRKHLEYYYSDVLKIKPKGAVPDAAHIVFDLARNAEPTLLPEKTKLNAGKDATGQLMLYDLDEEIVINESKVDSICTLFLQPHDTGGTISKVYATGKAKSADGLGGDFTTDDKSWKAFGDVRMDTVTGDETNTASLGFYIASPILHLTEGKRIITFEFQVTEGLTQATALSNADWDRLFTISFSGEKQWETFIPDNGVNDDYNGRILVPPPGANTFKLKLILLSHFNPVVSYDPAACTGNLDTQYPVVKFLLNQDAASVNHYEKLKTVVFNSIKITTTVTGITNLTLQNELGVLDATKPVMPFGPNPKRGSTFYVGHSELQHKNLTQVKLTLTWLQFNGKLKKHYKYYYDGWLSYYVNIASNSDFHSSVDLIRNKSWVSLDSSASFIENTNSALKYDIPFLQAPLHNPDQYVAEIISFTPQTQNGFLRLILKDPSMAFGHHTWSKLFVEQTIMFTQSPNTNTIPGVPYTPTLDNVRLRYKAEQVISLTDYNSDQGQFFHLLPFGMKKINEETHLLPTFELQKKEDDGTFTTEPIESAVLIGILNAEVNQNTSILLQVNEGSEDISVDPPEIHWNYLSSSGWKHFDTLFLGDSTDNLLQSGIVKFQVPVDFELKTTELPAGYLWIRAAIVPDFAAYPKVSSNGLPKCVDIYSNAAKAVFSDNGNDAQHYASALEAETIAKLYDSNPAIKKVNQPFASFGGKMMEAGELFYTRISERLRHKNRAITIWDYERIVLAAFPEIYMVKCLNHTGYEKNCLDGTSFYKENIPGQVMIIPVPFVTNLQTGNVYQPSVSAAKLSSIHEFIHGTEEENLCDDYFKALHCQLSTLIVENPKYETIQVTCKIKVKPCLDQFYYEHQLIEDLNGFLSPWITGDESKINFGGQLHVSQLIYFIEQLSYIDYLEDLTIEHKADNVVLNIVDPAIAIASTSRSILTSYGTHTIQPV